MVGGCTRAVPYGYGLPLTTLARGSWNDTNGNAALATGLGNAAGGNKGAFSNRGRRETSTKNSARAANTNIAVEKPERAGERGTRRRSIARRASSRWRKSAEGVIGDAEWSTWTACRTVESYRRHEGQCARCRVKRRRSRGEVISPSRNSLCRSRNSLQIMVGMYHSRPRGVPQPGWLEAGKA